MAKIIPQDIKDIGFVPEWFQGQTAATFDTFLTAVISEQADILEGRVGSTKYADTGKPNATYVKRAEKCLVCAELCRRRLIKLASDVSTAEGDDALLVRRTKDEYLAESVGLVDKIASGSATDGGDIATGCNVSSHFDGDTANA